MNEKHFNIVVVGHVDHGKSTLIGRLLFETNSLSNEKMIEIKRLSKSFGKGAGLAYITDQLKEERECNRTIDTTQTFLKIRKRCYVLIDVPGHSEFMKNMVTGTTQADTAILLVDVSEGAMDQTMRHLYVIGMLGISRIIVVLNKMDIINYEKERFEQVKTELIGFMSKLDMAPFFIVPISAKEGVNISRKSRKICWYKGPSLLKIFDLLSLDTDKVKMPLRFSVQDGYKINGEEIIVGKVISGTIREKQRVIISPSLLEAKIKIIKVFGKRKTKAEAGESIGLVLERSLPVKRGEIIFQRNGEFKLTHRFIGYIYWLSKISLRVNKRVILRCATQETQCIIEKIEYKMDTATSTLIEDGISELRVNESAVVLFKTERPIVVEKYSYIEELGRFEIELEHEAQGVGIIKKRL